MKDLILPKGYKSLLDQKSTENAIKLIKDHFQLGISSELRLRRVTAPMIVMSGTGINDNLNGVERPVSFPVKIMKDNKAEVVHSLAKWKRLKLSELKTDIGKGIYTDMNALRPDEDLSNIHSIYVDQWDWEKRIDEKDRKLETLKDTVTKIYEVFKRTEYIVNDHYPDLSPVLPEKITFIHSEELLSKYPDLSPKEREEKAAKEYGAVFIIGIGKQLANGEPHDGRAPDYDDWITSTVNGFSGLNGDIILWNKLLDIPFEVSSMGIRVDKKSLLEQLRISKTEDRKELFFHNKLIKGELPFTIGGGIGQSRLCMFFLQKAHIGEVQASIWPEDYKKELANNGIHLF